MWQHESRHRNILLVFVNCFFRAKTLVVFAEVRVSRYFCPSYSQCCLLPHIYLAFLSVRKNSNSSRCNHEELFTWSFNLSHGGNYDWRDPACCARMLQNSVYMLAAMSTPLLDVWLNFIRGSRLYCTNYIVVLFLSCDNNHATFKHINTDDKISIATIDALSYTSKSNI